MLNQAQIIGHLGRDPETRYLPSGEAVTAFSIATTEKWKDKQTGEQKEATEWHRITAFGKLAEIIDQYVRKGSLVYIAGKITTRKWTDKDGIERYSTEIKADTMKMLGGRQDGADSAPRSQSQGKPAAAQKNDSFIDDDIPF